MKKGLVNFFDKYDENLAIEKEVLANREERVNAR